MMLKRRWFGLMILVLSAGLTLAACGADTNATSNTTGDNDAGGTENPDGDPKDDGGGQQGCSDDDECASGEMCNDAGECVPEKTGCELDGDEQPDRCTHDFDETDFGPMSRINHLELAEVDECCFDFNGDGNDDNAVGAVIGALTDLDEVNQTLATNIDEGELNALLEHQGLETLEEDSAYDVNFYLGVYEDDALMLDPTSIEEGTYPVARLQDAELSGGELSAGPGTINMSIELLENTPLDLTITKARIDATLDADTSSIDDGIWLNEGRLGGVVRIVDIYEAINDFAQTCGCLDLGGEDLIDFNPEDLSDAIECTTGNAEEQACEDEHGEEDACTMIAGYCGALDMLVQVADVDTDNDGEEDALSIGAMFETEGVTVEGIGEAAIQE